MLIVDLEARRRRRRRHRHRKPTWPYLLVALFSIILVGLIVLAVMTDKSQKSDPDSQTHKYTEPQTELHLELNGEAEIRLEYGTAFEDAGAQAYRMTDGQKHSLEVETVSTLDASKLGEYTVTYRAEYGSQQVEKTRKVTIVDTQSPVITLVSSPEGSPSIGEEYQEEGFTAMDNYDGDLTASVIRTASDDGKTITYRVTDSSGNTAEVVRTVEFVDRDFPSLTLKGESSITITVGNTWKEPGYTASDFVDGDLTAQVTVAGKVNVNVSGTYVLNYTVKDGAGNQATAQRVVVVKPLPIPKPQAPNGEGKVIYLTFDDGPGVHTARLLEVLAKYDVKATFFVVNTGYLHLLDDIAAGGHSIGIHSNTHNYKQIYSSTDAFFADFNAMRDLIIQYSGVTPVISRFPGGTSNRVSASYCKGIMSVLAKAVPEHGFRYYDWNIDSKDAGGAKSSDEVFYNVTNSIAASSRTNFVVLQHDIHGFSVDAVERIILWGLEHGYTFAALDATSPSCEHAPNN